jgi:hypothetical protein
MVADGVLKEVTHVYAKRRQAPQLGEQLVGTIRVGGRRGIPGETVVREEFDIGGMRT